MLHCTARRPQCAYDQPQHRANPVSEINGNGALAEIVIEEGA
jgi:hypothetical protein